jgi:hypothetical protein
MSAPETRKAEFIAANAQAREIYLDGYLAGYASGFRDADLTAEAAAEHAARIFYAMDAAEAHQRAAARAAADGIDVARYRAQQAGGAHA